jgi:fatty acid desaturase
MASDERAAIEREIRGKAVRRVRARLGFYWHLLLFAMTNVALAAINLHYSPGYLWFVWPLCAWGAGLLLHAVATFQIGGMSEAMIEAEIKRELAKRGLA